MFLLFLRSWWKEIFIAAIVVGGVLYVRNLQNTVVSQSNTIATQKAENVILQANDIKLTAALDSNAKAFDKIDIIDKSNKDHFVKLQTAVDLSNGAISQRLAAILKEKAPATCEETIQYLITGAKGYK